MKQLAAALCLCAAPAFADDLDVRAVTAFSAAFPDYCMGAFNEDKTLIEPPQRYDVMMPVSYGEAEKAVVWQFRCNLGAYNLQAVMMLWTEFDGIRPMSLPSPDIEVVLEDPENYESAVKEVKILGWSSRPVAVNPVFDPATLRLTANGYWRGLGDASDISFWTLVDGGFRMLRYEVDATYDGEVNPQVMVNFE